jgi:hypothetical protein
MNAIIPVKRGTPEGLAARRDGIGGSDAAGVNCPPLGLTRTAAHLYSWNDGRTVHAALPSVTTVLRVVDKSGPLVGWAKRETAACAVRNLDMLLRMRETGGDAAATDWLKRIPDYQRDTAADIGSRVHRLVEQLARGTDPEVDPGRPKAPIPGFQRRATPPRIPASPARVLPPLFRPSLW